MLFLSPIELSSATAPVEPAVQISSYGSDESPILLPLALSFSSPSIVSGDFFYCCFIKACNLCRYEPGSECVFIVYFGH